MAQHMMELGLKNNLGGTLQWPLSLECFPVPNGILGTHHFGGTKLSKFFSSEAVCNLQRGKWLKSIHGTMFFFSLITREWDQVRFLIIDEISYFTVEDLANLDKKLLLQHSTSL